MTWAKLLPKLLVHYHCQVWLGGGGEGCAFQDIFFRLSDKFVCTKQIRCLFSLVVFVSFLFFVAFFSEAKSYFCSLMWSPYLCEMNIFSITIPRSWKECWKAVLGLPRTRVVTYVFGVTYSEHFSSPTCDCVIMSTHIPIRKHINKYFLVIVFNIWMWSYERKNVKCTFTVRQALLGTRRLVEQHKTIWWKSTKISLAIFWIKEQFLMTGLLFATVVFSKLFELSVPGQTWRTYFLASKWKMSGFEESTNAVFFALE